MVMMMEKIKLSKIAMKQVSAMLVWRSQPSASARASGSKPILHLSPAAEILQSNEIAGYVIRVGVYSNCADSARGRI